MNRRPSPLMTVHPRERGEHTLRLDNCTMVGGSSPRARGTHQRPRLQGSQPRFIPASAGNTACRLGSAHTTPVHPRERGEHIIPARDNARGNGSSPRARGTRKEGGAIPRPMRFIPASAGNTRSRSVRRISRTVHPRERGEHLAPTTAVASAAGSSPRARGTPGMSGSVVMASRFIPASAGNTNRSPSSAGCRSVHPRERGEHFLSISLVVLSIGSSPRARGTLTALARSALRLRFIPASAGNTSQQMAQVQMLSVHPRERGEHSFRATRTRSSTGSSPRARGTHDHALLPAAPARFIPASAGNTKPKATG